MTLFPELLDKAIWDAGFKSLSAFAREAGTSVTTVSKIIKNGRTPPTDQLPQWGRTAKLTGEALAEFIRAGEEMKAKGQTRAGPHLDSLVARVEGYRVALDNAQKALDQLQRIVKAKGKGPAEDAFVAAFFSAPIGEQEDVLRKIRRANEFLATRVPRRDHLVRRALGQEFTDVETTAE